MNSTASSVRNLLAVEAVEATAEEGRRAARAAATGAESRT